MSEITIKSVNLRGCWNLETINDECPICRNSVLEPCVECHNLTSECVSVMGECEHIYHLHCIEKWTKTKNSCPLDNKKWEFKKPEICQVIKPKSKINFLEQQIKNNAIDAQIHIEPAQIHLEPAQEAVPVPIAVLQNQTENYYDEKSDEDLPLIEEID